MPRFLLITLFLLSLIVFLFAAYESATTVLSINQVNQELASQNSPSDLNPLRILPPGTTPVPTPQTNSLMQLFTQSKANTNDVAICTRIASTVKKDSNQLLAEATQITKQNTATALGIQHYYTNTLLPTGKSVAAYDQLSTNVIVNQHQAISEVSSLAAEIKDFDCTSSNPTAKLLLFTTDANQATTSLQSYTTSVKNLVLAIDALSTQPTGTIKTK